MTDEINTESHDAPVIYVLSTGEKVRANSPAELIKYMRETSFGFDDPAESLEQYMFRVSERSLLLLHRVVRIDTPENFVLDCQTVGLIRHAIVAN